MRVLVIGANGKIGRRIVKKLKNSKHKAVAMVRDEQQKVELQALGAEVVVADLERDISKAFAHKPDAVIFTAGSGGDTSKDKTISVDLQGARKSIDEAIKHHVSRYIMVSALGANDAKQMPADMQHYFVAKSEADQHLVQSGLNYTIFRPGMLSDEAGNASVSAAQQLDDYGSRRTRRDDVATAIVEALDMPSTHKKVVEMVEGNTPIKEALMKL